MDQIEVLSQQQSVVSQQWLNLYNDKEHKCLQDAIVNYLFCNRKVKLTQQPQGDTTFTL